MIKGTYVASWLVCLCIHRTGPSTLLLDDVDAWWSTAIPSTRALLKRLLAKLPSDVSVHVYATASKLEKDLDEDIVRMFYGSAGRMEGSLCVINLTEKTVKSKKDQVEDKVSAC